MLSLRIAMKQYTIAYCDTAYALESGSADMKEEEKRKIRISVGVFLALIIYEKLHLDEYLEIKQLVLSALRRK